MKETRLFVERALTGKIALRCNFFGWVRPHKDGVRLEVDFEHICQIVDTVIDVSAYSKRALLHDLAHRAALVLKLMTMLFSALC